MAGDERAAQLRRYARNAIDAAAKAVARADFLKLAQLAKALSALADEIDGLVKPDC